jgi:hypothetical protein
MTTKELDKFAQFLIDKGATIGYLSNIPDDMRIHNAICLMYDPFDWNTCNGGRHYWESLHKAWLERLGV